MKKKLLSLLLAAAMMFSMTACGGTADTGTEAKYNVGICQLMQHVALDSATEGFMDALEEKLGDEVKFDLQYANGDPNTCSTITNTFVANEYDLILGNATAALQAASSSTSEIPILGTSITDYATALGMDDWTGVSGKNVSGTTDLAPLDEQAACIKELFPDAKNIGILFCSAEANSQYQSDVISGYLEEMGYTCTEYKFSDTNDVAQVTQGACDGSDVIYIPTDNSAADCTEAINNVALPAGVPIFAGEEGICSGCGVATLSINYYDIGYIAGEMAYDILVNGADPAAMEVKSAPEVTKKYNVTNATELNIAIPDSYAAIETEE
uniref:ABC transporter substrate-binding protein n=1 Tax=Agathobacter sp. TaxID=2021311 RepID=UPI0040574A60